MAKTPKAPEQDSTPAVSGADNLPESQQPEQTEIPPFEVDTPSPEMSTEEAAVLEAEGKAALLEMGEELPDPHEATDIAPEVSVEEQATEQITIEAAAPAVDAPEEEQSEDTRQEWEKSLAEVEAEQQPKRRGRPLRADKAEQGEDTSGQVGPKSDKAEKPVKAPKAPKRPKAEKAPKEKPAKVEPPAPPEPERSQPIDATRPGEVEQIVYLNLSELHPFKNHPFEVREDEEMRAMVSSVKDSPPSCAPVRAAAMSWFRATAATGPANWLGCSICLVSSVTSPMNRPSPKWWRTTPISVSRFCPARGPRR